LPKSVGLRKASKKKRRAAEGLREKTARGDGREKTLRAKKNVTGVSLQKAEEESVVKKKGGKSG